MSLEQLKAFLAKVKGDSSLQERLKAAKSSEDVVGIAKEHGHEFTADKFSLLSEDELEVVAGGSKTCPGFLASLCVVEDTLKHHKY
tara:strand:+ start:193 stop:450 length:258 start_codon:yes stop_codon:yes gene_type:complete